MIQSTTTKTTKLVFILAGQSNMAGRGRLPIPTTNNNGMNTCGTSTSTTIDTSRLSSSSSSLCNVNDINSNYNNNIFSFSQKTNEWIMANDPLHNDKPEKAGVGPGISFAKEILKMLLDNDNINNENNNENNNVNTDTTTIVTTNTTTKEDPISSPPPLFQIMLIPCAWGGSPISRWLPKTNDTNTNDDSSSDGDLFHEAIERTKLALSKLNNDNNESSCSIVTRSSTANNDDNDNGKDYDDNKDKNTTIPTKGTCSSNQNNNCSDNDNNDTGNSSSNVILSGILWHQGESDCGSKELATNHAQSTINVFNKFRKELNKPNLPIIIGGLGTFLNINEDERFTFANIVQNGLQNNICDDDNNCNYVSVHNLNHIGDRIHFDTKSQYVLGKRYAYAWIDIIQKQQQIHSNIGMNISVHKKYSYNNYNDGDYDQGKNQTVCQRSYFSYNNDKKRKHSSSEDYEGIID